MSVELEPCENRDWSDYTENFRMDSEGRSTNLPSLSILKIIVYYDIDPSIVTILMLIMETYLIFLKNLTMKNVS